MSQKKPDNHVLFIRNFPRSLSKRIKSQAALAGQTIGEYLSGLLEKHLPK